MSNSWDEPWTFVAGWLGFSWLVFGLPLATVKEFRPMLKKQRVHTWASKFKPITQRLFSRTLDIHTNIPTSPCPQPFIWIHLDCLQDIWIVTPKIANMVAAMPPYIPSKPPPQESSVAPPSPQPRGRPRSPVAPAPAPGPRRRRAVAASRPRWGVPTSSAAATTPPRRSVGATCCHWMSLSPHFKLRSFYVFLILHPIIPIIPIPSQLWWSPPDHRPCSSSTRLCCSWCSSKSCWRRSPSSISSSGSPSLSSSTHAADISWTSSLDKPEKNDTHAQICLAKSKCFLLKSC